MKKQTISFAPYLLNKKIDTIPDSDDQYIEPPSTTIIDRTLKESIQTFKGERNNLLNIQKH